MLRTYFYILYREMDDDDSLGKYRGNDSLMGKETNENRESIQ